MELYCLVGTAISSAHSIPPPAIHSGMLPPPVQGIGAPLGMLHREVCLCMMREGNPPTQPVTGSLVLASVHSFPFLPLHGTGLPAGTAGRGQTLETFLQNQV